MDEKWFEGVDDVVEDELRFKAKLGIGEDGVAMDETLPLIHRPSLCLDVRQVATGANHTLLITAECPERIWASRSVNPFHFSQMLETQKILLRREKKRRRAFLKALKKSLHKTQVKEWRKARGLLIPTTLKARAMAITSQRAAFRHGIGDGQDGQVNSIPKRPASAASYRRRTKPAGGGRIHRLVLASGQDFDSGRQLRKWEVAAPPVLGVRTASPVKKSRARPSTAR